MNEATSQEVFDFVAKHLLTQNKKSITNIDGVIAHCLYKSSNGLNCAIGCLIPKESYDSEIEQMDLSNVLDYFEVDTKHDILLESLRLVHDDQDVENWQEALNDTALKFNLFNVSLST